MRIVFLILVACASVSATAAQSDSKSGLVCPTISVSGPQRILGKGELGEFNAKVTGEVPKNVRYFWLVNAGGQIVDGQGTPRIKVVQPGTGENVTATVTITGLQPGCTDSASETIPYVDDRLAILIDSYHAPASRIDKIRLRAAARELSQNPNSSLLLIEYFRAGTSEFAKRDAVRRISTFLKRNLKGDNLDFKIVTAIADENRTKIYRLPPGTAEPIP